MVANTWSVSWIQRATCLFAAALIVSTVLSAGTLVAQMAQDRDYTVTITQLS